MKKRNLILIALAITTILVFTQIGAMANIEPTADFFVCHIKPENPGCQGCNSYHHSIKFCNAHDFISWDNCCTRFCSGGCDVIKDHTNLGPYCCAIENC